MRNKAITYGSATLVAGNPYAQRPADLRQWNLAESLRPLARRLRQRYTNQRIARRWLFNTGVNAKRAMHK